VLVIQQGTADGRDLAATRRGGPDGHHRADRTHLPHVGAVLLVSRPAGQKGDKTRVIEGGYGEEIEADPSAVRQPLAGERHREELPVPGEKEQTRPGRSRRVLDGGREGDLVPVVDHGGEAGRFGE